MTSEGRIPSFAVVPGRQVHDVLRGQHKRIMEIVEHAYRGHGAGDSVNPPSYFLRFPDRPTARIIALPASLGGATQVDGVKWISSFPANVAAGIPRASAVLVLNDRETGYPIACMEGSIVSAARTAASAALGADWLTRTRERPRRLGLIGTGLIARHIHDFLVGSGWEFDEVALHDLTAAHADGFEGYLRRSGTSCPVTVHDHAESVITSSDLIVFATVASKPHVTAAEWFSHNPVVLHVSLRDLAPAVLLSATNIVDDVEHCLKADTSPHLTEQLTGGRQFVAGTLCDVMTGDVRIAPDRPVIFSPFGLGVLDLAVGKHVYDELSGRGVLGAVNDFFHDIDRYASAGDGAP
jgi:2,3-diaminopropionate biosynthesis protein SbnB